MNEVIFQKIQQLKEEIRYLKDNKTGFLRTLRISQETRKIVERSVYLCTEIALDVADLVIITEGFPKPSTFSDTIRKLGTYKIIKQEFAQHFIYIAGLRNFLAHDYLTNTEPMLEKFMNNSLEDMDQFVEALEKSL